MNDLVRRLPAIEGELLVPGGLGVPGYLSTRDLSRMKNVTPGEESPARPLVCIHGFAGCPFEPSHIHQHGGVTSPCCSNCGRMRVFFADNHYGDVEFYDEQGRCPECRD